MACILGLSSAAYGAQRLVFGRVPGPVAEMAESLLSEAYAHLGIEIQALELPLERSLLESDRGHIDGEVCRAVEIEARYPHLVRVPALVSHMEIVVFTKTLDVEVAGWASLRPYRLAIRRGAKLVEARTRGYHVATFLTSKQAFTLVARGRYDLCVTNRLNGYLQLRDHGLTGLRALEPPLESVALYHYLHQKHADLVPRIAAVIERMRAAGRIEIIRAAHIEQLLPPGPGN